MSPLTAYDVHSYLLSTVNTTLTRSLLVENKSSPPFIVVLRFGHGNYVETQAELGVPESKELDFYREKDIMSIPAILNPGLPFLKLYKKARSNSKMEAIDEDIALGDKDFCVVVEHSYEYPSLNYTCGKPPPNRKPIP